MFRNRSVEKEHLDQADIPADDLYRNLDELEVINKLLGGYRVSAKGLRHVIDKKQVISTVLDIGSGGGGSIRYLNEYSRRKNIPVFFFGVDMKPDCIKYATTNLQHMTNKFLICEDYKNLDAEFFRQMDIVHCSLFLHHLTNREILNLMRFCRTNNCTLVINDLHRHWMAYFGIRILTALLSRSKLIRHDAPVSVKRGFRRRELKVLLRRAGFRNHTIRWCWAFRFLIIAEP